MIKGVIDIKNLTVESEMIKLDDIFCISIEKVFNNDIAKRISNKGFSRIPVYIGEKSNIIGVMLIKTLIGLDLREEKTLA